VSFFRDIVYNCDTGSKLLAAHLRVARVTAGLVESNGSRPPGLWLTSPDGSLPRTGISSGSLHPVIEHGLPLPFTLVYTVHTQSEQTTLEARSTYHRVSGGGVGLGGVGVGPAEHIASKLNHSTLQAQTHSWTDAGNTRHIGRSVTTITFIISGSQRLH